MNALSSAQDNLLRRMRNAVLVTVGARGNPHAAPVWYLWDGEQFSVSTTRHTMKFGDVRRDPRVAICIDDQVAGDSFTAYGRAELIEDGRVGELTWPLLLKYHHEAEAAARWERINADGDRVILRLTPRWVLWRAGVR